MYANFSGWPTQRQGSSRDYVQAVQAVQANMWSTGYMSTLGSIDGQYGSNTVSAVKSFQSRQGLASDGITGPSTCDEMGNYTIYPNPTKSYYYQHPGSTTL
nr:peptidoglycan-binding domain-containing protein [Paenibacillus lactis]